MDAANRPREIRWNQSFSAVLLTLGLLLAATLQMEAASRSVRKVQPRGVSKASVQQKVSTPVGNPTVSPFAPAPGVLAPSASAGQTTSEPTTKGGEITMLPKRKLVYVYRPTPPPSPEKIEAERQKVQASTVAWLKQRADAGSERAQFALGMRYLKGDGVERDIEAGRILLRKALDNGYLQAEQELRKSAREFPSWAMESRVSQ